MARKTNKPVLILTPLAVSYQTLQEAQKFGIEAARSLTGELPSKIIVTNYERLHYFTPDDFAGVVADESSILKSFNGVRRSEVTEFMRTRPYRLLCTATAAPNDYIELGTSSEAIGQLGHMDMLLRFFKNDQNSLHPTSGRGRFEHGLLTQNKWRFKGHAAPVFWRWVCSWARAVRTPSDLGFDDGRFLLPSLIENHQEVTTNKTLPGMLFPLPAVGLKEQRDELRLTIHERCERVAALVADTEKPALSWCHLNDEGDLLAQMIPDAVQVSGDDSDEEKEEKFLAFTTGQCRVLVTKPKIGAWGLNFQHCAHVTFFASHSFEQYYQGVRRCWRFGQTRPVVVDVITTEGQREVMKNLQRKATAADQMFTALVGYMQESLSIDRTVRFPLREEMPAWL